MRFFEWNKKMFETSVLFAVLLSVVVGFAILLNTLVLFALNRRYHKRTFKCYVWMALSACDLFRSVFEAPLEIDAFLFGKHRFVLKCSVQGHWARFLHLSSVGMLTVIFGERYISVCHPGKLIRFYGKKVYSITCVVFCIFYAALWSFMPLLGIGKFINDGEYCCLQSDSNPRAVFIYKLTSLICTILLPVVILFYCSILTLREFKLAKERTINVFGNVYLANNCENELKEIRLLIIMAVILTATWIPYDAVSLFHVNQGMGHNVLAVGEIISQSSTVSTPIFFMCTDKSFQLTLSRVFFGALRNDRSEKKRHMTVTSTQLFKINKIIKGRTYSAHYTNKVDKFSRPSEIEMDPKNTT